MPPFIRVGPREFLNGKRGGYPGGRAGAGQWEPALRVSLGDLTRRTGGRFRRPGADGGPPGQRGELLAWGEESGAEGTPGQSGGKCAPRKELAGKPVQRQVCWVLGDTPRFSCQYFPRPLLLPQGACRYHRGRRRYIQGRVVCQLWLCWDRWDWSRLLGLTEENSGSLGFWV